MHVKQRNLLLFPCFLFALCCVGHELQPGASEKQEGEWETVCLEQNTVEGIMFYDRNASRTNQLQAGS